MEILSKTPTGQESLQVKLTILYASNKGVPLGYGEHKNRSGLILGISNRDSLGLLNLNTIAITLAVARLLKT